jgi:hypothetical protein
MAELGWEFSQAQVLKGRSVVMWWRERPENRYSERMAVS